LNIEYKNGNIYEGLWSNDKKHGAGAMSCRNQWKYNGVWQNNHRVEVVNLTDLQGNEYPKVENYDFLDNAAAGLNGNGIVIYKGVGKYTGEFKNGAPNGEGVMDYLDKTKYIGEFKAGKRHGQGMIIKDNKEYSFLCEDDKIIKGQVFVDQDGTRYFASSEKDGKLGNSMDTATTGIGGITYCPVATCSKVLYRGSFINGKEYGGAIDYKAEGVRYTGGLRDGKKHGNGKLIYLHPKKGEIVMYNGVWKNDLADGVLCNTDGVQVYTGPFKIDFYQDAKNLWNVRLENLDGALLQPEVKELYKASKRERMDVCTLCVEREIARIIHRK